MRFSCVVRDGFRHMGDFYELSGAANDGLAAIKLVGEFHLQRAKRSLRSAFTALHGHVLANAELIDTYQKGDR